VPLTDIYVLVLMGGSAVTGTLFVVVEGWWAKEPIFPLRLLRERDVWTSYVGLGATAGAQMAVCLLPLSLPFVILRSELRKGDGKQGKRGSGKRW